MIDAAHRTQRLALYGFHRGANGIGRVMCNLANAVAAQGVAVDVLVSRADSADLRLLDPAMRVIELGAHHGRSAVAPLADYLSRERPAVLLANREWANRLALRARRRCGVPVRLAFRVGSPMSTSLARRPWPNRLWHLQRLRRSYRLVDHVIANSVGVADDVRAVIGSMTGSLAVLPNPSVPADIDRQAAQTVPHPWFQRADQPLLLAAGRLVAAKDFALLLRAFAILRRERPARLVIIGEGPLRAGLLELAAELGVADDLALPGFVTNPAAWMAKASLFVVSSVYEGSPNVLIEALACGTSAVSTDCPHGPREILDHGRWGRLTPPGDAAALADAMAATLDAPLPAATLRAAMAPYRADVAARAYLHALGLAP